MIPGGDQAEAIRLEGGKDGWELFHEHVIPPLEHEGGVVLTEREGMTID